MRGRQAAGDVTGRRAGTEGDIAPASAEQRSVELRTPGRAVALSAPDNSQNEEIVVGVQSVHSKCWNGVK